MPGQEPQNLDLPFSLCDEANAGSSGRLLLKLSSIAEQSKGISDQRELLITLADLIPILIGLSTIQGEPCL